MRKLKTNEWIGVSVTVVIAVLLLGFGGLIFDIIAPIEENINTDISSDTAASVIVPNLNMVGKDGQDESRELEVYDFEVGKGNSAEVGELVTVDYVGMFEDGRVFDSSIDRGEPISVTLGAGEVIPGFDQGIRGMREGGKRRIIIPSEFGYGERGAGPIPPNTTIVFDVDLISVK